MPCILTSSAAESLELKRRYEDMIQVLQKKEKLAAPTLSDMEDGHDEEPAPVTFNSLQRGDTVKILSLNTVGEVIGKMQDKNKLVIRTNMMKVEVRVEDLEMVRSE